MGYQTSDYVKKSVRTAAILTTGYVAGTILTECQNYNQMILLVAFTKGSLTTAEIKIEFSADGTNYYQETFSSITTGTSTDTIGEHAIGATGNYRLEIPVLDRYIKVSVKGTGTVTSSEMTVDAILGRN